MFSEFNKENVPPKKRGRPRKDSLTQPKPRNNRKPLTSKFRSQPQLPASPPDTGLDYDQFAKKIASLPTELEVLQIKNKREIERFRTVWINHNAGLSEINQELGIEVPNPCPDFGRIATESHYSPDIFGSSTEFSHLSHMPIISPPPPSVPGSVKQHISNIEETIITDQFVFGIEDLEALALHLKVDFEKLLNAATILRNNGTLESDDDEVIPSSQSPRKRGDFWKERISQTQSVSLENNNF